MKRTKLSLYYLAGYLFIGGLAFFLFPKFALKMFLSSGDYDIVVLKLAGLLLLALGIIVVNIIRVGEVRLYKATLVVRLVILLGLNHIYIVSQDPMILVLGGIVGLGFVLTETADYLPQQHVLIFSKPSAN